MFTIVYFQNGHDDMSSYALFIEKILFSDVSLISILWNREVWKFLVLQSSYVPLLLQVREGQFCNISVDN